MAKSKDAERYQWIKKRIHRYALTYGPLSDCTFAILLEGESDAPEVGDNWEIMIDRLMKERM